MKKSPWNRTHSPIPAVPGSLRYLNRLTIMQLLRAEGPISKADLARNSAISLPTVSKVIDDLHANGLAEVIGTTTPSARGGKRARLYRFNGKAIRVGAVLMALDGVSAAICNGEADFLLKAFRAFGADRSPKTVSATIVSLLKELLAELSLTPRDLLGVGIGVPGLVDSAKGIVNFIPHLKGWHNVRLGLWLIDALQVPVLLDNESHVQALAEYYWGKGADCDSLICVETGIGLAAAFLFDGQLYRGTGNTAGEVGHMTIQEDGPPCECGNLGCWEVLASITWLANQARQALQSGRQSSIPVLEQVKAQAAAVYAAALAGDALALELVRSHGKHFGTGIANLINALNPRRIILHGESVAGGLPFLQAVLQVVQQRTLKRPGKLVEIVFSDLGDDVGLIGATSLVMESLFQSATYPASIVRALPIEEASAASATSN